MALSTGTVLNNRYRIVSLLGQGGMGSVYRAWDLNLNIPVAVKENLDATPEAQRQFIYEAQILAHLSHPNLPRVTDYFSLPQGQYLVMDFVDGEDLQSMVERLQTLPEAQALTWVMQICDALDYLHSQQPPVIHRDIKPANIKVRADGRAMLVDFGIAKIFNPNLATTMGAKAVTPGYSPPEQYGSGRTDARSDIYSLGATLYFMLTGKVLPESVQRAAENRPIQAPRTLNPRVSPAVEQAVIRATDVSTSRRFQSVSQMRAALMQRSWNLVTPTAMVSSAAAIDDVRAYPRRPSTHQRPAGFQILGLVLPVWLLWAVAAALVGVPLLLAGAYALSGGPKRATPTPTQVKIFVPTQVPMLVLPASPAPPEPSATLRVIPVIPTTRPILPPATHAPPTLAPPTLAPPPTAPPALGAAKLVLEKGYNCRGSPDSTGELLWTFQTGAVLQIVGKNDSGWWLVKINDPRTRKQQCWISGGQASGDIAAVPVTTWTGTADTAKTPWP